MSMLGRTLHQLPLRLCKQQWPLKQALSRHTSAFHSSARLQEVKPFVLADIGEGIKEVQIIQWFVQPGARVEQFDKLCEVASDKAIVEITSRFDGVIKQLHYQPEAMAQVGKPLCDIDIQSDISPEDEALITPTAEQAGEPSDAQQPQKAAGSKQKEQDAHPSPVPQASRNGTSEMIRKGPKPATPAVRGLLKELNVEIEDVEGTGRDGRVLKEDVHRYAANRTPLPQEPRVRFRPNIDNGPQRENAVPLTPVQAAMFKTMTRSLSIPQFLYTDEIDLSTLSLLRQRVNPHRSSERRLSYLPFVIKAVSIALHEFAILNARVDESEGNTPKLIMREKHNIGVAMDTPQGLLVPNVKNVAALSIRDIAEQLAYLQAQAKASKLTSADLMGGTITVSNIGNIGGTYVAPVILSNEVAILGIGKARVVPAFGTDGEIVKKTVGNFSWSADHRVVDGATMARMGERVRELLEEPALMVTDLR